MSRNLRQSQTDTGCYLPTGDEYERRKAEAREMHLAQMRASYGPTSPPWREPLVIYMPRYQKSVGMR